MSGASGKTFDRRNQLDKHLRSTKAAPKQAFEQNLGAPMLAHWDGVNSADLWVASTDFTTVIDDFVNEVATNLTWLHNRCENDVILKQSELFTALSNKNLNVKKSTGLKDKKVDSKLTVEIPLKSPSGYQPELDANNSYIYRKGNPLKGEDKKLIYIKYVPIMRQETRGSITKKYEHRDTSTPGEKWVKMETKAYNKIAKKIDAGKTKTAFGLKDMSNEFSLVWLERFWCAHEKIKAAVSKNLSSDDKHWYLPISDSLGSMFKLDNENGFNLRSIDLPLTDPDYTRIGVMPVEFNQLLLSKMDPHQIALSANLTQKTHCIFRTNMGVMVKSPIGYVADNKVSHGENLTPDTTHWKRMTSGDKQSIVEKYTGKVKDIVGDVSKVLDYLALASQLNDGKMYNPSIQMAVEKSMLRVDWLGHVLRSDGTVTKEVKNEDILRRSVPGKNGSVSSALGL